jgi:hypothetical protein
VSLNVVKPFLLKSKHEKSKESSGFESTSTTVTALLYRGAFLLYNDFIHTKILCQMTNYSSHFQKIAKETIKKLSDGTLEILNIEQKNDTLYTGGPVMSREVIITCMVTKSQEEKLQDRIKTLEEENRVLNEKLNSVAKIFKEDDDDGFPEGPDDY